MDAVGAEVRLKALEMITKAKSSHIGSCFSCADILVALYGGVMRYDPTNPDWEGRDRFILSKGHAAAVYYAVLAKAGFFEEKELHSFGQLMSSFTGHVNQLVPGVEVDTGSLGHGLSIGLGMAIALKDTGQNVYVLCSDGEMNEGSIWEAIMLAGHLGVDNLKMVVDSNGIQACGETCDVVDLERSSSLRHKLAAFGWSAYKCNGHDVDSLKFMLQLDTGSPVAIVAETVKGSGVSFMENSLEWHYKIPTDEEYQLAVKELEDEKGTSEPYNLSSRVG